MTGFVYLCLDAQGRDTRGQLEAPSEAEARRRLKEAGLMILRLEEGQRVDWRHVMKQALWIFSQMRGIGTKHKVLCYQQMQLMLKAGLTLFESLGVCARLTESARFAQALERVAAAIRRGSSVFAACGEEKRVFDRLTLRLIAAGETTGELGEVFGRLAAILERRVEVRRQLITALVYPGFVLCTAIVVICFLVIIVIPRFAVFLNGRGKAIPWAAQTMLDISDWLTRWGWLIASIIVGSIVAIPVLRRFASTRFAVDFAALYLPALGGTFTSAAMAQTTWIFGMLVRSHLTVLETLRICAQVTGNAAFANAFAQAAEDVLAGKSLALALQRPVLPGLVQHMAAVGEKSGQVDTVMESLGQFYQKDLDARVKFLAAMIEPALILAAGGIVAFVYFAFFQAMLTVSTGG
ncbi:MAG: type II secretion system F family protein [Zoogloeaceae bacterium]|jgi:type IV pilus assembly protein PilC|nr:type II secretion system F family protein [Zoogloeaceae bacterium]